MNIQYQERPRKGGGNEIALSCQTCQDTGRVHAAGTEVFVRCEPCQGTGLMWRRLLPIVLSADEAQKVHAGTKTQHRELVKPQPPAEFYLATMLLDGRTSFHNGNGKQWPVNRTDEFKWILPRYRVGDVLWVREPWQTLIKYDSVKPTELPVTAQPPAKELIFYEGEAEILDWGGKLRPATQLPLRLSRPARYEVTAVRLESVNKISEADALADGCEIRTAPSTRFDDAPWVWVYEWRRV